MWTNFNLMWTNFSIWIIFILIDLECNQFLKKCVDFSNIRFKYRLVIFLVMAKVQFIFYRGFHFIYWVHYKMSLVIYWIFIGINPFKIVLGAGLRCQEGDWHHWSGEMVKDQSSLRRIRHPRRLRRHHSVTCYNIPYMVNYCYIC